MSVFSSKKTQQGVYAAEEAKEKTQIVCDIFTEHRLKAFLCQLLCRNLISGSMNTVVDFSAPGKGLSV